MHEEEQRAWNLCDMPFPLLYLLPSLVRQMTDFPELTALLRRFAREERYALHVNESACRHAGAPRTRTTLT